MDAQDFRSLQEAYKNAAEADEFLFGDYDYEKEWLGKKNDDVN
jgi:hypothetical protein